MDLTLLESIRLLNNYILVHNRSSCTEVVLIKTNLRLAQDFSVFSLHHSDLRTNLETLACDLRYRHSKLIIGQIMYGKIKSNKFKLNFF